MWEASGASAKGHDCIRAPQLVSNRGSERQNSARRSRNRRMRLGRPRAAGERGSGAPHRSLLVRRDAGLAALGPIWLASRNRNQSLSPGRPSFRLGDRRVCRAASTSQSTGTRASPPHRLQFFGSPTHRSDCNWLAVAVTGIIVSLPAIGFSDRSPGDTGSDRRCPRRISREPIPPCATKATIELISKLERTPDGRGASVVYVLRQPLHLRFLDPPAPLSVLIRGTETTVSPETHEAISRTDFVVTADYQQEKWFFKSYHARLTTSFTARRPRSKETINIPFPRDRFAAGTRGQKRLRLCAEEKAIPPFPHLRILTKKSKKSVVSIGRFEKVCTHRRDLILVICGETHEKISKLALTVLVTLRCLDSVLAVDDTWDGGVSGGGTGWLTATNWLGDVLPGTMDRVIFGTAGTATTIGINMNGATNNGPNNEAVASITLDATDAVNRTINNSSSTASGTLTINGAAGILVANDSTHTLTFSNRHNAGNECRSNEFGNYWGFGGNHDQQRSFRLRIWVHKDWRSEP